MPIVTNAELIMWETFSASPPDSVVTFLDRSPACWPVLGCRQNGWVLGLGFFGTLWWNSCGHSAMSYCCRYPTSQERPWRTNWHRRTLTRWGREFRWCRFGFLRVESGIWFVLPSKTLPRTLSVLLSLFVLGNYDPTEATQTNHLIWQFSSNVHLHDIPWKF